MSKLFSDRFNWISASFVGSRTTLLNTIRKFSDSFFFLRETSEFLITFKGLRLPRKTATKDFMTSWLFYEFGRNRCYYFPSTVWRRYLIVAWKVDCLNDNFWICISFGWINFLFDYVYFGFLKLNFHSSGKSTNFMQ